MAFSVKEMEARLPPEFFSNEGARAQTANAKLHSSFISCFPSEFPLEFVSLSQSSTSLGSTLSSPLCSATDAESSDERDEMYEEDGNAFLLGQAAIPTQFPIMGKQMATEKQGVANSPVSTLYGMHGLWSGSRNESPQSNSSPDSSPFAMKVNPRDVILAAADQVARLKLANQRQQMHGMIPNHFPFCQLGGSRHSWEVNASRKYQNLSPVSQTPSHELHTVVDNRFAKQYHFHKAACNPSSVQEWLSDERCSVLNCAESVRPKLLAASGWPHVSFHNHHADSHRAMFSVPAAKSVFPTGSISKRERSGTGVFLPRQYGANVSHEPLRKTGQLEHTIPDRKVSNARLKGFFDHESIPGRRCEVVQGQRQGARPEMMAEVRLPKEWSY